MWPVLVGKTLLVNTDLALDTSELLILQCGITALHILHMPSASVHCINMNAFKTLPVWKGVGI